MLTLDGLRTPGWEGWLLAVLLLVAVRPLACVLSLVGSRMDRPHEKAFVAWFGVRGVGTLYYVAVIVAAGVLPPDERLVVGWAAIAPVLVSLRVHGITAGPAQRRKLARGPGGPPPGGRGRAR